MTTAPAIRDRIRELRRVPARDLMANPRNWRTHPKAQQAAMAGVLSEIGYADALLARDTPDGLMLIDGHLRAETTPDALVPVLILDVTEDEADKLLLTLDPLAAMATADKDSLAVLLASVQTEDAGVAAMLEDLARSNKLSTAKAGLTDPDAVPPTPDEPTTQPGDLWLLGEHRLLCGDSVVTTDVERLMSGERAPLMLTDPPYGINVVKGLRSSVGGSKAVTIGAIRARKPYAFGGVRNNARGTDGAAHMVDATLYMPVIGDDRPFDPEPYLGLADNLILFGGNYYASKLADSRCWIVWDKDNTGNFADAELAWTSFDKGVRLYKHTWNGLVREGPRDVEGLHRMHPTQKPVGLFETILRDFSDDGQIILDAFLGSGTTLIACERLGRRCYAIEIEPRYVDVAVRRWEQYTGQTAVLDG